MLVPAGVRVLVGRELGRFDGYLIFELFLYVCVMMLCCVVWLDESRWV